MKLNLTESTCYSFIILDMASYIKHLRQEGKVCRCDICKRFEDKYLDALGNFTFIIYDK